MNTQQHQNTTDTKYVIEIDREAPGSEICGLDLSILLNILVVLDVIDRSGECKPGKVARHKFDMTETTHFTPEECSVMAACLRDVAMGTVVLGVKRNEVHRRMREKYGPRDWPSDVVKREARAVLDEPLTSVSELWHYKDVCERWAQYCADAFLRGNHVTMPALEQ